jgi:hypothetical protein
MKVALPLLLVSLFISCGKSKSENQKTTPSTHTPEREEDGTSPSLRYTSILMEENCGFWTDCDFSIRTDFAHHPVTLTANFVDNGVPEEGRVMDVGHCDFQVTLSEDQAIELQKYADALRICHARNIPAVDRGFDGLFVSDSSGKETMAYKSKSRGQDEAGEISYLCGGSKNYYQYMKQIISPVVPEECPDGYERLFR